MITITVSPIPPVPEQTVTITMLLSDAQKLRSELCYAKQADKAPFRVVHTLFGRLSEIWVMPRPLT